MIVNKEYLWLLDRLKAFEQKLYVLGRKKDNMSTLLNQSFFVFEGTFRIHNYEQLKSDFLMTLKRFYFFNFEQKKKIVFTFLMAKGTRILFGKNIP